MIPYGKQDINLDDINAVIEVLKSDFLTQGPKVPEFENIVSAFTGAKFSIAFSSATSALHLACLALGVCEKDIVWTSAITFVASANCARYCGADVDFVDINPESFNMCPDKLEEKLLTAELNGKLPKVVIPVHMAGQSCQMDKIHHLSRKYGFKIIEDASHAIGARFKNSAVGSCLYSDITVFSFHPVKIITTAEGGLATTNDSVLSSKMQLLRSHGITRDISVMTEPSHGSWYYQQLELGYNYRLTELQAALGISQMSRLEKFVKTRNELAIKYNTELGQVCLSPKVLEQCYSSFHLYIVRIKDSQRRRTIFENLKSKGIGVNLHYIPVYKHPYYRNLGFKNDYCENAEQYYKTAISIPIFNGLKDSEQDYIISSLKELV
jgi:UDP-4-amino-4,6-dideoxy-N-acetyl-beta-L-altrosamine transaminase